MPSPSRLISLRTLSSFIVAIHLAAPLPVVSAETLRPVRLSERSQSVVNRLFPGLWDELQPLASDLQIEGLANRPVVSTLLEELNRIQPRDGRSVDELLAVTVSQLTPGEKRTVRSRVKGWVQKHQGVVIRDEAHERGDQQFWAAVENDRVAVAAFLILTKLGWTMLAADLAAHLLQLPEMHPTSRNYPPADIVIGLSLATRPGQLVGGLLEEKAMTVPLPWQWVENASRFSSPPGVFSDSIRWQMGKIGYRPDDYQVDIERHTGVSSSVYPYPHGADEVRLTFRPRRAPVAPPIRATRSLAQSSPVSLAAAL